MALSAILDGSALRIAARFAAFTLAGCRTQPLLKGLSLDHDLIGLHRIFSEGLLINCFFPQRYIDPVGCQFLLQAPHGLFNFLFRGPASGTGLLLSIKQPLPFYAKRFDFSSPATG